MCLNITFVSVCIGSYSQYSHGVISHLALVKVIRRCGMWSDKTIGHSTHNFYEYTVYISVYNHDNYKCQNGEYN